MIDRSSERTVRFIRLGLGLGLVYGFVEAAEVILLSQVPGALSWRNGNSSQILWVAPLFYGAAFMAVGVTASICDAIFPCVSWELALVFVLLLLGGFLAVSLQGQIISDAAAVILGLGIAAEGTRQYRARRERLSRLLTRGIPLFFAAVVFAALITVGGRAVREAVSIARLPAAEKSRPNVLLLVMDTQRADHLSLYGYERCTSPRLDSMAATAIVFDKAVANSSWTLPTHATLFTGRLPFEHRAGMMRRPYLDAQFPTIAEALQRHGYATGGFVANTFWAGSQTRLNRGFIRYEDFFGNPADAMARTALGRRLAYGVFPRLGFVDIPGRKRAEDQSRRHYAGGKGVHRARNVADVAHFAFRFGLGPLALYPA